MDIPQAFQADVEKLAARLNSSKAVTSQAQPTTKAMQELVKAVISLFPIISAAKNQNEIQTKLQGFIALSKLKLNLSLFKNARKAATLLKNPLQNIRLARSLIQLKNNIYSLFFDNSTTLVSCPVSLQYSLSVLILFVNLINDRYATRSTNSEAINVLSELNTFFSELHDPSQTLCAHINSFLQKNSRANQVVAKFLAMDKQRAEEMQQQNNDYKSLVAKMGRIIDDFSRDFSFVHATETSLIQIHCRKADTFDGNLQEINELIICFQQLSKSIQRDYSQYSAELTTIEASAQDLSFILIHQKQAAIMLFDAKFNLTVKHDGTVTALEDIKMIADHNIPVKYAKLLGIRTVLADIDENFTQAAGELGAFISNCTRPLTASDSKRLNRLYLKVSNYELPEIKPEQLPALHDLTLRNMCNGGVCTEQLLNHCIIQSITKTTEKYVPILEARKQALLERKNELTATMQVEAKISQPSLNTKWKKRTMPITKPVLEMRIDAYFFKKESIDGIESKSADDVTKSMQHELRRIQTALQTLGLESKAIDLGDHNCSDHAKVESAVKAFDERALLTTAIKQQALEGAKAWHQDEEKAYSTLHAKYLSLNSIITQLKNSIIDEDAKQFHEILIQHQDTIKKFINTNGEDNHAKLLKTANYYQRKYVGFFYINSLSYEDCLKLIPEVKPISTDALDNAKSAQNQYQEAFDQHTAAQAECRSALRTLSDIVKPAAKEQRSKEKVETQFQQLALLYKHLGITADEEQKPQQQIDLLNRHLEQIKSIQPCADQIEEILDELDAFDYQQYVIDFKAGKIADAYDLYAHLRLEHTIKTKVDKIRKRLAFIKEYLPKTTSAIAQFYHDEMLDRLKYLEADLAVITEKAQEKATERNLYFKDEVIKNCLCVIINRGIYYKYSDAFNHLEAEAKPYRYHGTSDFDSKKFHGLHVSDIDFTLPLVRHSDFQNATLTNCTFPRDLCGINLKSATLINCKLSEPTHLDHVKIDEKTSLDWAQFGPLILKSNFTNLHTERYYLENLARIIGAKKPAVVTGELLTQLIEAVGRLEKPDDISKGKFLLQQKQRAKLIIDLLMPYCSDDLKSLSKIHQVVNNSSHYLRRERDWWRLASYGNTNTWNHIINAVKDKICNLTADSITEKEYGHLIKIQSTPSQRCYASWFCCAATQSQKAQPEEFNTNSDACVNQ